MNILFVCNANIVRSFMAERVFKSLLKSHGTHEVKVSSAGLLDMHGAPADEMARQILQENGLDDKGHHSRMETFEFLTFPTLRGAERRSNLMVYRMVMGLLRRPSASSQ